MGRVYVRTYMIATIVISELHSKLIIIIVRGEATTDYVMEFIFIQYKYITYIRSYIKLLYPLAIVDSYVAKI